jgi:D-3-phosphoglycerate dehydrogenase
MRPGAVLLNFSREGVVDERRRAGRAGCRKLGAYVCDFPSPHCTATRM